MDSSTCTVSWEFLTDSTSLFGTFLEQDAGSTQLSGKGRVTAVFDPKTFEFQYFTVVISAGDNTLSVTLLDMVLYWDTKNSTQHALVIPDTIQADAYKASTGVSSNGGYDEMINPLAEELIEVYGGTADVTHYEDGSSLFWTLEKEGQSVTINYTHEEDPVTRFEDSYEFLVSFYGEPAEETEDGAYFYSSDTGGAGLYGKGRGLVCGDHHNRPGRIHPGPASETAHHVQIKTGNIGGAGYECSRGHTHCKCGDHGGVFPVPVLEDR